MLRMETRMKANGWKQDNVQAQDRASQARLALKGRALPDGLQVTGILSKEGCDTYICSMLVDAQV